MRRGILLCLVYVIYSDTHAYVTINIYVPTKSALVLVTKVSIVPLVTKTMFINSDVFYKTWNQAFLRRTVVQWRQRNVQKFVLHVRRRRRILRSLSTALPTLYKISQRKIQAQEW